MKFSDSLRQFRANAPAFDVKTFDAQMERALKREALCEAVTDGKVCGKPVAMLRSGAPCKFCKPCLAVHMVGYLGTLPL